VHDDADVIVVGAGVVGCALAWFLARAGLAVTVLEAQAVGTGASGRNSGLVEHPYDAEQAGLYAETLALLADALGDAFPPAPVGALLLVEDAAQAEQVAGDHAGFVGLAPEVLDPAALAALEPGLAPDLWACRLHTGHPVAPALAVQAFARRAREAGARLVEGRPTRVEDLRAPVVVVAAGAASGALLGSDAIAPLWGATVGVELERGPRHALIDGRISDIQLGADAPAAPVFSLIGPPGGVVLGSTFLADEPDPAAWAQPLLDNGARFWPALRGARVAFTRACARPRAADGRPYLGRVRDGVWLAAGHGGRGISTGAASARLVADAILAGDDASIPAPLRAARLLA
jgi:glycine/D-amino acid oxidase-like deaminating enzyme